jgi:hypothetical protein
MVLWTPYKQRTYLKADSVLWSSFYLICKAIGTATTPGLLCQPRVIVKMIVEKQMECRLLMIIYLVRMCAANNCSASLEIPCILWIHKVKNSVHNNQVLLAVKKKVKLSPCLTN